MIKSELLEVWQQRERELGRDISVKEVADATNLDWDAINNLKYGKTGRFDSHVIGKICQFFGIPEGQPVPFLKVYYSEGEPV
ncbi:MAG: helix-turn-helix domain-containing protein [Anaerolineae bacterium]|nr:helix-turn-helix domain-containing protein [Anaerolineae bacterium]